MDYILEREDFEKISIVNSLYKEILRKYKQAIKDGLIGKHQEKIISMIELTGFGRFVFIQFSPEHLKQSGSMGGFGLSGFGHPFIYIELEKFPGDDKTWIENFKKHEQTIKHEIYHMITWKKTGIVPTTTPYIKDDISQYYNHPDEINSYFLQALGKIKSIGNKSFLNHGYDTFKKFLFTNMSIDGRIFYQFLSDKNKNRVDKRIYDAWIKMKNENTKKI